MGHSLGGRIVLEMVAKALLIPHLTVLVDINPDPVEGAKGAIDEHLDILIKGAPTTKGLIENIKTSLPLSDSRVLSKVIPTLLSAGPRLRTANKAMPFDPHIKNYMQAEPGLDEWDLITQLNSPLAFVRGSFSSICDRQIDIKMSSLAPRFLGVEVIKGAGHAICLEQPVALAGALANLISKALRGA